MIPDAPHLPPWVIAYAEYDGRAVALLTTDGLQNVESARRFGVVNDHPTWNGDVATYDLWWETDDEAEARAIFDREAARLLTT